MAAAFSVIFFVVVPQLEQSLKEQRLDSLEREARSARAALELPLLGGAAALREGVRRRASARPAARPTRA